MTVFRCAVRADDGPSFVRMIRAPSRDQAILLLLAQGLHPISVVHDVPSLANRLLSRLQRTGGGNRPARTLSRLIAAGLTVEAATQALAVLPEHAHIPDFADLSERIAAGEPLSLALQDCRFIPAWITGVLALAKGREDETAILHALANIDLRTDGIDRLIRHGIAETAILLLTTITLACIALSLPVGTTIALIIGIALLALFPNGTLGRIRRDARAGHMLAMMATMHAWGANPADAAALACLPSCDKRTRRQIEDNLTQFASPLRLDLMIGDPLGLSPINAAILRYSDPDISCRHLSATLTKQLRGKLRRWIHGLRLTAFATAGLVLVMIQS